MTQILFVGLGGAIGAIARFLSGKLLSQVSAGSFPWSTLLINLLGSFLIGICVSLLDVKIRSAEYSFFVIGVLGGFTTFSTFSLEALNLLRTPDYTSALIYILASAIGGILFCAGGIALTKL